MTTKERGYFNETAKYDVDELMSRIDEYMSLDNKITGRDFIAATLKGIIIEYERVCVDNENAWESSKFYHDLADDLSRKYTNTKHELSSKEVIAAKQAKVIKRLQEKKAKKKPHKSVKEEACLVEVEQEEQGTA